MFEPFKNNPESILFSSVSYTVPAGRYALASPLIVSADSFGDISNPSPSNCQINFSVVFRSAFSMNLGTAVVTVPSGVWSAYFGLVQPQTNPPETEQLNLVDTLRIGRRVIVQGGDSLRTQVAFFGRRLSFLPIQSYKKKYSVPSGTILSGSGSFRWYIVQFKDYQ